MQAQVNVAGAHALSNGTYSKLSAAFTAINNQSQTGNNIVITITSSPTAETSSAILNSGTWSSMIIFPTTPGLSISGNINAPLIELNGADILTIDGRVNASGSAIDLSLSNASTSATTGTSTIRFINDASGNVVKYCNIKGSSTGGANVLFSTTTGSTGNDNNTIEYNNITNAADANRPINAIYSLGTVSFENSGNIVSNNNIYDVFNRGSSSNGIFLDNNNTSWTIFGNNFYESSAFVPTAQVGYMTIAIISPSGINFSVYDNFIGGSSPMCGGAQWTKTNAFNSIFIGIYINAGTGTTSSVQNNIIRNFDWSNSLNGSWTGIQIAGGDVNIGTVTGNTIGDITGTGSILVTSTTTNNNVYGISLNSSGTVDCQNNKIGSILTVNSAANASNIYCIHIGAASGTTTISNNTIGSTSTPNSIFASSSSTGNPQIVRGIMNSGAGTINITGNTIANLTNGSQNTVTTTLGVTSGITSTTGIITISNNSIHNLINGNAYLVANQNASVSGISLIGGLQKTVTGNTIYNLSNTYSSFTGSVMGIFISGGTGNVISENFIHDLSVDLNSLAVIYGIRMASGSSTYANNIISLGGNSTSLIYGIYETGAAGNDNNIYFNTVYIGGTPASGTNKSFALYSANNTNARDFRNNILINVRSTAGGYNQHYSLYIFRTGGTITCSNNDYIASGTGGILGYYGALKTTLPIVTGQDGGSLNVDPGFVLPGGPAATDYIPSDGYLLAAIAGTGITADYAGTIRSLGLPSMGAYEVATLAKVEIYKSAVLLGGYSSLKGAFDALNAGTFTTGDFEIRVYGNTTEYSSAILNASGTGSANYNSVTVFPTGTGFSINGNIAGPIIELNGADNVTIDGRVMQTGSTADLTISNTSTSATAGTSTIRLINDATNNVVKYCNIKGSSNNGANIIFSTTTGSTGNDNNTIDRNNITNAADANRPVNAIYSLGTVSLDNSGNIVSNNNFSDFLSRGVASNGIFIDANNSAWTISGNSFYETSSFVPVASVAYYAIVISSTTGNNFSVTDNYIGGSAALCGGSAWIKTNSFNNSFTGIYINAGTGTSSNIQNNIIRNFNWSNSLNANWTGIQIAGGDVNAGTVTGNTIGNATGTGSITVTAATTNSNLYGINITGAGTVVCQNNTTGSITAANAAANASNIYGINIGSTSGSITVDNNTIGSTSTGNSIIASSGSTANAQNVFGIYNAGTGTIIISDNTVANITNGTNNSNTATQGKINGITSTNGSTTISNNSIHDLTIGNANNLATNNASVCGISLSGTAIKTITGNEIYNLSNTLSSFAGSNIGIYLAGGTGNNVSANFIHDLSVDLNSSASVYGIKMASGTTTYANNIITLGGNTPTTMYGIYQTGSTGNDNYIYFNTIYIGGNPASFTKGSYGLFSTGIANIREYRNNILVNERSTTGGSNLHFALYIAASGGTLNCSNNDYLSSGTGGILGYYGALKTTLPIVTGQDGGSLNVDPGFNLPGGPAATDYIPSANTILASIGTGILTDYAGTTRSLTLPSMGAFEIAVNAQVEVYKSAVLQGSYSSLKGAFDALNNGTLNTGDFEIRIISNVTESSSAILNASGTGSSNYNSVTIFPTGSGYSISGNTSAPLIILNGADNVTIDGRVNATGTFIDLTVINTSTSALASTSTIQFINDATNNVVKYCNIKGSSNNGANIIFSTTTGSTGNDNNTIDRNNITNAADANRPVNAIYSLGTVSLDNSGNIVSNNNFSDFLSRGVASNGIFIDANNSAWTISGNSFYETSSFVPVASVAYYAIVISSTTGNNFSVTDNYIGGSAALCGGSAWIKTNSFNNSFTGIYINAGTGTSSNIQNNIIRNFNWSNSLNANWTGIQIAGGDVNAGTVTGNTIGNATGTGSITVTAATTNSNLYGINITGAGTVVCQNNTTGSITAANAAANASNIYGINIGSTSGSITVDNNTIGSTSTGNSIIASSGSTANAQNVFGIYNAGTGTIIISDNTVANITNGTNNSNTATQGKINGITSTNGSTTISNNSIHDLTIGNANNLATNNASVCGISLSGTAIKTITGNEIYNLSNTLSSFAGSNIGIYLAGGTGNNVSANFIHDLSVDLNSSASVYGIKMASGTSTYSNNIISLGGNSPTNIYGIYQTGSTGNDSYIYFNTVYVGGNPVSGSNLSYALYSIGTLNVRDYRNNVLVNARSTTGGYNLHYAIYFVTSGGTITCDFNDYYTPGTGGILGRYGTNKTVLPIVTSQDINSFAIDPLFANPGGTNAIDYLPSAISLVAATGTGIITDFAGIARSSTFPSMGAYEYVVTPTTWRWTGATNTDWITGTNWNYNTPPVATSDVVILDVLNDPVINESLAIPAECQNLTINTNGILTIAAGKALRVNGTLANNAGITGLVIKSDATGDGKLLNNTADVQATVELYLTGGLISPTKGIYHYIIPPVETMSIGSTPTIAEVRTAFGITNFSGNLLQYNEPSAITTMNQGWQYFDNYPGVPPGFTSITSARGYNINLYPNSDIIKFNGELNATQHTFNISYTTGNYGAGWNLVGNPYPCDYDLNGVAGLGTVVSGMSNTVYYNNNGTYQYWNVLTNTGSTLGYTDIVPPMTGFYVVATNSSFTQLVLPVTSKSSVEGDTRSQHKGNYSTEDKGLDLRKIKLLLSKNTGFDETIVLLADDAESSYNEHYDAFKMFNENSESPGIYSNVNGINYFMKAVADPSSSPIVIPLKVVVKEPGTHEIKVTEFDNLYDYKVTLRHGDVRTVLNKNSTYSFTSGAGTFNDFELIFGNSNLSTSDEDNMQNYTVKSWYNKDYLYINSSTEMFSGSTRIVVYDMQGKAVYITNKEYLVPGQTTQIPISLPKGVYIININTNNRSIRSKFVVI